jgi:hypothetical protein
MKILACHTLALFGLLCACGGKGSSGETVGKVVAECKQYEAALDACYHSPSGFAEQPAMLAKTEADRVRLAQSCMINLERLKTACR